MNGKDVLVILKIQCDGGRETYQALALELGLSVGAVHQAVRKGLSAGLLVDQGRMVVRPAFEEWVLYGVKYFFPLKVRGVGRGIPTGLDAAPFADDFHRSERMGWVWSDPDGEKRGELVEPLTPSVPFAAGRDLLLYRWLVIVDLLRGGSAHERNQAESWVLKELGR